MLTRSTVQPFTDKQVEWLALLPTRQRSQSKTRGCSTKCRSARVSFESLEQQTATSEVLKVISSSPGQLKPVFQAMLENATRVCEADCGVLFRLDGDVFRAAAMVGLPSAYADDLLHKPRRVDAQTGLGRLARTRETVHITDLKAERYYAEANSQAVAAVDLGGIRTYLGVPLLKENELIGAILLYCKEVRPFTDKQIELVRTLQHKPSSQSRTHGCSTSCANLCNSRLQPPTCSRSSAVLRSIYKLYCRPSLKSAARVCNADNATITREKNGVFYRAEAYGFSQEFMDYVQDIPINAEKGRRRDARFLEVGSFISPM